MFIGVDYPQHCKEIREYFRKHGANLSEEANSKGLEYDLADLINVCQICYELSEADAEITFNGILSILIDIDAPQQTVQFCHKLEAAPNAKMGEIAFNVLYNFYEGLTEEAPHRVDVYCTLVRVAGKMKSVSEIFTDIKPVKEWLTKVDCPVVKVREVYRVLHKELLACQVSDMALKVIYELLNTYSEQDAKDAKEDAERCITACLADKNTFLMDHLLPLKPIKALEGTPIHHLLKIFVYEKLAAYQEFYKKNEKFVDGLGLNHEDNVNKMRLLTFMMMAESKKELPFEDIERELEVTDVEGFVLSALKTKLVSAKINHICKKVVVISTMHRTFEKREWTLLKDTLQSWFGELDLVEQSTKKLISAQYQLNM